MRDVSFWACVWNAGSTDHLVCVVAVELAGLLAKPLAQSSGNMASIPNKRILAQPSKHINLVKINVQGLKGGRMGERLLWGASGSFQKPAVSQKSKQLSEREKKSQFSFYVRSHIYPASA